MRKILFILVLLFLEQVGQAQQYSLQNPNQTDGATQWLDVGNIPIIKSQGARMAISRRNEIAVYFMDTSHQNRGTVKMFDGAGWINVGDSASLPLLAEIAFSPAGELYVAGYEDTSTRIKVVRFANGVWQQVGKTSSMPYGSTYSKLSFAGNGTVYLGFSVFDSATYSTFPNVMFFNGTDWKYLGTPNLYNGGTNWFDFKLSPSDIPYIIMGDDTQPSLAMTCLKFEGNAWTLVGPPGFSTCGNYVSIDFSSDGTPYVCGGERYNLGGNRWKAAVLKYDGTNWQKLNGTYISEDSASYPKLLMSSADEPIVVYGNLKLVQGQGLISNSIIARRFKNGIWEQLGNAIDVEIVREISLKKNAEGNLYTASSSYSKANSYVKYLGAAISPCNNNNWTGAVSSDWENVSNWSCGTVPGVNTDVIIPAGLPRYPVLNVNATVSSVTVNPSATITVTTGVTLNVLGH